MKCAIREVRTHTVSCTLTEPDTHVGSRGNRFRYQTSNTRGRGNFCIDLQSGNHVVHHTPRLRGRWVCNSYKKRNKCGYSWQLLGPLLWSSFIRELSGFDWPISQAGVVHEYLVNSFSSHHLCSQLSLNCVVCYISNRVHFQRFEILDRPASTYNYGKRQFAFAR